MATLYKDYPTNVKTKELKRIIKEYIDELFNSRADINIILQLSPLIQLGQSELQNRQNKRIEITSTLISISSLVIAIISVYIAVRSDVSSDRWEKNQNIQLNTLDIHNKQLIDRLDSLISINKALTKNSKKLSKDSLNVK
jgi:hypothetical protein